MKSRHRVNEAEEARMANIIDMSLSYSAMLRLFAEGSKQALHHQILATARELFGAESEEDYVAIHASFCEWGTGNVMRTRKRRNGRVKKKATPASYGQVAKTLDVALMVVVYFCHLPDCRRSEEISPWLNAAVDTKMMAMLRRCYPKDLQLWPTTIERVDGPIYGAIQGVVRKFIEEKHNGEIMPVQFDNIYWRALNR